MPHLFNPNIARQSRDWADRPRVHTHERHLHLQTLDGIGWLHGKGHYRRMRADGNG
jgi:hypothetical protein